MYVEKESYIENRWRIWWNRKLLERKPYYTGNTAEYGDAIEEQQNIENEDKQKLEEGVSAAAAWPIFNAQGIYDKNGDNFGTVGFWHKDKNE